MNKIKVYCKCNGLTNKEHNYTINKNEFKKFIEYLKWINSTGIIATDLNGNNIEVNNI